jgi:cobalt-zinc-cadmium efflux system outer membrane protein
MFQKNTRAHGRLVRVCRFLLTIGALVQAPYIFAQTRAASPTGAAAASRAAGTISSQGSQPEELERLLQLADSANPSVRAARRGVEAARARVSPAALPPDPMLMVGIQNLPLGKMQNASSMAMNSGDPDPMTMRMVGIGQTIPYPGKLSLRRRSAEHEVDAARASLDATARQVVRDIKYAYYELAFIDQALSIVGRNRDVLAGFIRVTETRYAVGISGQQDVLKARVEATQLAVSAVTLTEQRRGALARLNALLDRPSDTPIDHPEIPASVARAAIPAAAAEIRFTSAALGARAADSPLPPLAELQETAVRESPEIREREAMIAAQASRLELARKDVLPDFDVSLQYGQRGGGLPDMITALVSVPIPVFKARKQNQFVVESGAQLASLEAERVQKQNEIRADVARLVSELERSRAQLALYVKALLPQARASLSSATASYQVGRIEFLTVLDDQATVFNYETEYFRVLSDFAKNLAELERVVGKEIL